MEKSIMAIDMSGVCEKQQIFKDIDVIDAKNISGTDCYCDADVREKLAGFMSQYPSEGIHFIDGGNYHYLSKLWTDRINEPFDLIVFDHHTDMQQPAFGAILSCGGWIRDVLDTNVNIKNVFVIGVNEELITQEMKAYTNVHFITKQEIQKKQKCTDKAAECVTVASLFDDNTARVYISVDKDVLKDTEYKTNWDQGDMSADEMFALLEEICAKKRVIGIDICGEMDMTTAETNPQWNDMNNEINKRLMHFINYLDKK